MKKTWILLTGALCLALAACQGQTTAEQPGAEATPTPRVSAQAAVSPTASTGPALTAPPEVQVTPEAPAQETPAPTATAQPAPEVTAPPETPPAVPSDPPVETPQPQTPAPDHPSDEEVLGAYRDAVEAYNWFDMCTLPGGGEGIEVDGHYYTRVTDERFPTLDDLRGHLKTLFSDEVIDALLPADGTQYVDIDGVLYVEEGARGGDITKGGVVLQVLWPEEGDGVLCTVQATVELLDIEDLVTVVGEQVYQFPYQKVGDKWVFTHFEPIF